MTPEIEVMFSDKDFPIEISNKMIEKGFRPIAIFYNKNKFSLLSGKRKINYKKEVWIPKCIDIPFQKWADLIPAWSLEQLWDYLNSHRIIDINKADYLLQGDIDFDSDDPRICIFYATGSEKLVNSIVIGKLTDPKVPADILKFLHEKGLL